MARDAVQAGKEKRAMRVGSCPLFMLLLLVLTLPLGTVLQAQQNGQVQVRDDSPTRYTVVRGDTLWDIAGRFLEEPWLWPQVWQINPQIENPDLIYPGDVIELAYVNGSPVLRLSRSDSGSELPTIRLSPQVRREQMLSPIPAISLDQISSYLTRDTVLQESEFLEAPYLVAEANQRFYITKGDTVFARGNWQDGVINYDIVRRGRPFLDPDTGLLLGAEALAIGTATLQSINGDRGILLIENNLREIKSGDRLVPHQEIDIDPRLLPAPPPFQLSAAIVSMGGGKEIGGLYDSLVINKGRNAGLQAGHVLAVLEPNRVVYDQLRPQTAMERLKAAFGRDTGDALEYPGERVGTALVYRVMDEVSVALVLKSSNVIRLNDRVATP